MSVGREKGGWDFIILCAPRPPKAIWAHPGKCQPQGDRNWEGKCVKSSLGEIIEKLFVSSVNIQDKNGFSF